MIDNQILSMKKPNGTILVCLAENKGAIAPEPGFFNCLAYTLVLPIDTKMLEKLNIVLIQLFQL